MKILGFPMLLTVFLFATVTAVHAQRSLYHKYRVSTLQTEITGTSEQRKLYHEFLTKAMAACPYISNFTIVVPKDQTDTHQVVWRYEVDGWADITRFYHWVNMELSNAHNNVLRLALTPYGQDFAIGGEISMTEKEERLTASGKKQANQLIYQH